MRKMSLQGKITFGNIVVVFAVLVITLGITMRFSTDIFVDKIENNIVNVGQMLSRNPLVINSLESGTSSDNFTNYLDDIISRIDDVDIIVVANNDGTRIYHPSKENIGKRFVGGDESSVIMSGESYLSEATGTLGNQKRYFTPVLDKDNNQIGFIMVSTLTESINKVISDILKNYIIVGSIIFSLGIVISLIISKGIKRTLLGYEPEQFTKLYLQRQEVLSSLEEGIIAIDDEGKIIVFNDAALNMLNIKEDNVEGKFIKDVFPQTNLLDVIESKKGQYSQHMTIEDVKIITDRIPIIENNKAIGAVCIFRNKTEVTKLAEELTGVNQIIDALRANTHEFMNKLHVILGLLQINKVDEAKSYISNINEVQRESTSNIISKIKDPTIAALLIGKVSRAKEIGIKLNIYPNSYLENNNKYLSRNDLITVLGNLIENSIDSINEKDDDFKEISLLVYNDNENLIINVHDTGKGIKEENIEKIYQKGFSTKGSSRGTGLYLIKNIVETHNGEIDIESEENEGSCFTIRISNKHN
ncbi:ATP-binding protein [Romboutsia sp. 1001713B170207_170306_H8]|uniref:ATP-binding protein n=1 Tax=Romboutsia sp. 1001713B170207_170306_H8 TaxID=2787112 RepID=UPI000822AB27|nr:sensor histidine kinase [Romboutsia sp. 1001713B170207_170306_H8]SCI04658.1 Sensor histidine kinase DcuS [uncultured Clostridium sp.]